MEKMNSKLALWIFKWIQPYLSEVIAMPLGKRPEAVAFAKAFSADKTLRECIRSAVSVTPGADEFATAEKVYTEVKEALERVFASLDTQSAKKLSLSLDRFAIPDGDGDPSNDVALGTLIRLILAEVASK